MIKPRLEHDGLIAEYECYLANAGYFQRSPDTSTWPPHWADVHARDAEHAQHWHDRAMAVKAMLAGLDEPEVARLHVDASHKRG